MNKTLLTILAAAAIALSCNLYAQSTDPADAANIRAAAAEDAANAEADAEATAILSARDVGAAIAAHDKDQLAAAIAKTHASYDAAGDAQAIPTQTAAETTA